MSLDQAYIERVVNQLPHDAQLRAQVGMELRSHIAEREEHGHTIEEALRQLGDPVVLAESYLAAVPLIPASFWRRGAARTLDFLFFVLACAPLLWALLRTTPFVVAVLVGAGLLAVSTLYPVLAEYYFGKTIGKHVMQLRVVRESGTRISFGQSIVRQLPVALQVFWIDVFFALFTEKHQRAFELLSKTRVVVAVESAPPL